MNQEIKLFLGSLLFSILANLYLFLCHRVALNIIILRTEAELRESERWWASWVEISGNASSRTASFCPCRLAQAKGKQHIPRPTRDWCENWFLYSGKCWPLTSRLLMPHIWGFLFWIILVSGKLSGFHKLVYFICDENLVLREKQIPLPLGMLKEKICKLSRW